MKILLISTLQFCDDNIVDRKKIFMEIIIIIYIISLFKFLKQNIFVQIGAYVLLSKWYVKGHFISVFSLVYHRSMHYKTSLI